MFFSVFNKYIGFSSVVFFCYALKICIELNETQFITQTKCKIDPCNFIVCQISTFKFSLKMFEIILSFLASKYFQR